MSSCQISGTRLCSRTHILWGTTRNKNEAIVFPNTHQRCPGRHTAQSYGVDVLNKIRKWEDSEIRKGVIREQLRFCTLCRNRRILPNFARVKPPVKNNRAKETTEVCGCKLLKVSIDHHHSSIHWLGKTINNIKNLCEEVLLPTHLNAIFEKIQTLSRAKTEAKRGVLDQKFKRLEGSRAPAPGRWVKNLSCRTLTEVDFVILSKGLKFNVQGGVKNEGVLGCNGGGYQPDDMQ
ncbi:uncharacterized protein LOC143022661 [Oratosquilla oratoria]|uniref:uncharacterized protein LOC143022661 n=1 Tax=Oratosquilla oratoria TaxID=337810 RepID=UPI003F771B34